MSSFGDRVRIKVTAETVEAGVGGLEGDVYGFTTPSVSGVTVVGGAPDDHALNVWFESLASALWFRPDLLEFLHHNDGSEVRIGNVLAVRRADGSWFETTVGSPSVSGHNTGAVGMLERVARLFRCAWHGKRDA